MALGHPIAGVDLVVDSCLPAPLQDDGTVIRMRAPSPGSRQISWFKVVCGWLPKRRWNPLVVAPGAPGRERWNTAGPDASEGEQVDLEDVIGTTAAVLDLGPCRGVRGD
jgi:hypothetical protein